MSSPLLDMPWLSSRFDCTTGAIEGAPTLQRRLADLRGCFVNQSAFDAGLARGNPVVYSVATVQAAHGVGDLHYGIGTLQPGRIGDEYLLTRGHLHRWREAAEFYFGFSGEGMMLLQDEQTSESRLLPLCAGHAVYVPSHTAHRTINVGTVPVVYLAVYPAVAGHDYDTIAKTNFRSVVIDQDGQPTLVERISYHA